MLPGITFTAKTVLDVNIYTETSPISSDMIAKLEKSNDGDEYTSANVPLVRGVFPRPYAITSLPHRDITMQNILNQGDFDHYQGM